MASDVLIFGYLEILYPERFSKTFCSVWKYKCVWTFPSLM